MPEKDCGPATQSEPKRAERQRVNVVFFIRIDLSRIIGLATGGSIQKHEFFIRDLQMVLGVYNADRVLASHVRHKIAGSSGQDHGGVLACASERMEHNFGLDGACWNGGLSKCAAERIIDI